MFTAVCWTLHRLAIPRSRSFLPTFHKTQKAEPIVFKKPTNVVRDVGAYVSYLVCINQNIKDPHIYATVRPSCLITLGFECKGTEKIASTSRGTRTGDSLANVFCNQPNYRSCSILSSICIFTVDSFPLPYPLPLCFPHCLTSSVRYHIGRR